MEPFRLKLKVGPHEFEAEGEQESVERQLAVWRELISTPSAASQPTASAPPAPPADPNSGPADGTQPAAFAASRAEYDKLFRHDGRVVSLTVMPNGGKRTADGALLILLGQKIYNGVDLVTGQTIIDGLKQSGVTVERMDRSWGEHLKVNVLRIGQHRGVKYRLTNPGVQRANELVKEMLQLVA